MEWQNEIRSLIRSELNARKAKNRRFSMRSFASKLSVSPALVSGFLNTKIGISSDSAQKIIEALNLPPAKADYYFALINKPLKRRSLPIQADSRFLLDDWLYIAVWIYFDLPQKFRTARYIANQLNQPIKKIKVVIDLLLDKKLIRVDSNGKYSKPEVHLTAGNGPSDLAIKNFHCNNLEVAIQALHKIPSSQRHFSTVIFSANSACFSSAVNEIESCLKRTSALSAGTEDLNEIYQLSVSFFPLKFNSGAKKK